MNQSWSIIIFGYNEEKTIANEIYKVNNFFIENNISRSEIVIVDDGSTDNSEQIIRGILKSNKNINYIRHKKNLGIGPALLSGYNNARHENLAAIPADGQFDINELTPFINFPEKHFVSFYRKEMNEYSLYRKIVTFLNKSFNQYLLNLNVKDINWVKAYKNNELKEIELELQSSLVASEICAKFYIKGYKSLEALSVYHDRTAGIARGASFKTISKAMMDLSKLFVIVRKFNKTQRKN
ncbi:MAG TPA: glycosyltransferase family 2 protein [Ignavibacteria bacterium]|nr:glycosyltransferase family 2 protein [Ignavibacteria bacterium]